MSTSSNTSNRALNELLKDINKYNLEEAYNNNNIVKEDLTRTIPNTIISYNRELGTIFYKICFSNIFKDNTI